LFRRVLIANRGEISRRVARTCRGLGISVAAVYSDADANAPYVHEADVAVHLPGNAPGQTYLLIDSIIAAARRVGADAIHPGYGFLAENAEFARRCAESGLIFIGPSAAAIEAMGSKVEAKRTMADAGVPMLASAELPDTADVQAMGEKVGFPLLVKASAGGGGKAMRIVHDSAQLGDAVEACRREARSAFGDATVFLERYLVDARHVEVQVFGDTHGNVIHLGERECSIQRRYQKVIEDAPSPAVSPELREAMGRAAVAAARAIDYVGAGTVEFLLDSDGEFSFLEMNTRLQVEHPVTEAVTGLDLVRLQLLVAAGQPLPDEVLAGVPFVGHAIEARLYAEDADAGFLPATGTLARFDVPVGDGLRVDAGVESGSEVSVHYDPMLAKVIAYAPTRAEAASQLAAALQACCIDGVVTNQHLLIGILRHPAFLAGAATTSFLTTCEPADLAARGREELTAALPAYLAAAALATLEANRDAARVLNSVPAGFRSTPAVPAELAFDVAGRTAEVRVLRRGRRLEVTVDDAAVDVEVHHATADLVDLTVAGVRRRLTVEMAGDRRYVRGHEAALPLRLRPRFELPGASVSSGSLLAPMPGVVLRVHVAEGERVAAGDPLVVLEAMKMEHTITATVGGVVTTVAVREAGQVRTGDVVAVITPDEEAV
jgi:acetyl/propionyl-CoA carboxylase alpha subunit